MVGIVAIFSGYYLGERQAQNIRMQEENIETLKGNNLKLQSDVEKERITRLQLEESLEPRILESNGISREKLKAFEGTPFIIEAISDGEVLRAAGQIRFSLQSAGWNELGTFQTDSEPEGVRVETINIDESQFSPSAAILVEFLEANGWEAKEGLSPKKLNLPSEQARNDENIPDGTLRIRIGIKPTPYFMGKIISGLIDEKNQKMMEESMSNTKARREILREKWGIHRRLP